MKFLIAATPECKIFQSQHHQVLFNDPAKIYLIEKEPILVDRGSSVITFQLGVPQLFGGPKGSDKEQDALFLIEWLCGGKSGDENQETDCYGIALLDLSDFTTSAIADMLFSSLESGSKMDLKALSKKAQDEVTDAKKNAAEISRKRVYRAIRQVVTNYDKQNALNKEGGLGDVKPSMSEYLCKFALRNEIKAREDQHKKIMEIMNQTSDIIVPKGVINDIKNDKV